MANRKIAECLNLRINVGNYQHIELTKYAEEQIEYDSAEERMKKEDELREDLLESMIRSMKAIPERLGKGVESAQEVEEAIKKAIPEWLETGTVPNIANKAERSNLKAAAEQKANKDENSDNLAEITVKEKSEPVVTEEVVTAASDNSDEDLFEEDEMPEPEKVEEPEKSEEVKEVKDEPKKEEGELNDFFDEDDDLFGDA